MPFIQTQGLHIHYEQAGEGSEALVLLHGNFGSWRWWQPLLEHLPAGYGGLAPDLRGCGDTEKPHDGYTIAQLTRDLEAFTVALDIQRFHLLGHSLGGAIALQFALDRPESLLSLVLVAPAPAEGLSAQMEHHFDLASLILPDTVSYWLPTLALHRPLMHRAIDHAFASKPPGSAELQSLLVEDALRMSPLALSGFANALNQWNVQAELSRIRVPVLIVGGEQDPLVPPQALTRTAKGLPNAQLVIWPHTGHAPQLEHPEHFQELLWEFLQKPTEPAAPHEPPAQPSEPGRLQKLWDQLSGSKGSKD